MKRIIVAAAMLFIVQAIEGSAASIGGFVVTIIAQGGPHAEIGSDVFLPAGTEYAVRVENQNDVRASARITIGDTVSQIILPGSSSFDLDATFDDGPTFSLGVDCEITVEFRIPRDPAAWHWFEHWIESRKMSIEDLGSTAIVKRDFPMVNGTIGNEYLLSTDKKSARRMFATQFSKDTTGILSIGLKISN